MESYICKVTSAGQLTLPKKVRKGLGLKGSEYVDVALLGKCAVIWRLREEEVLETIRRRVKRSGLTRARLQRLLKEARKRTWTKRYCDSRPSPRSDRFAGGASAESSGASRGIPRLGTRPTRPGLPPRIARYQ